jgi:hypothetical protein
MNKFSSNFFCITFFSILLAGCASSDLRSLANGGEATPNTSTSSNTGSGQVRIFYTQATQPKHFRILGRVSANNDNLVGIPHSDESIAVVLKQQAADLGANGVLNITSNLEKTSGDAVLIK